MKTKKQSLRIVESPPCRVHGASHAVLVADDGEVVSVGNTREAASGEALRPGEDMLFVDADGYVVDRIEGPRAGPPMVTTPAYRTGWDAVFGKRTTDAALN